MQRTMVATLTATLLLASAAPVGRYTSNPIAGFPHLRLPHLQGFMNIDPDGVYRAYIGNGQVVDAARLTPEQVETFLEAVVVQHTPEAMVEMRAQYANADSAAVPDEELLNPPEHIKPLDKLAEWAAYLERERVRSDQYRVDV